MIEPVTGLQGLKIALSAITRWDTAPYLFQMQLTDAVLNSSGKGDNWVYYFYSQKRDQTGGYNCYTNQFVKRPMKPGYYRHFLTRWLKVQEYQIPPFQDSDWAFTKLVELDSSLTLESEVKGDLLATNSGDNWGWIFNYLREDNEKRTLMFDVFEGIVLFDKSEKLTPENLRRIFKV